MSFEWFEILLFTFVGVVILVLLGGDVVYFSFKKWSMKRAMRLRDERSRAQAKDSSMKTLS